MIITRTCTKFAEQKSCRHSKAKGSGGLTPVVDLFWVSLDKAEDRDNTMVVCSMTSGHTIVSGEQQQMWSAVHLPTPAC